MSAGQLLVGLLKARPNTVDVLVSVDQAWLTGGNSANRLEATAFAGPVTLDGGAGNELLAGEAGADSLIGGVGTDNLTGSASWSGTSSAVTCASVLTRRPTGWHSLNE